MGEGAIVRLPEAVAEVIRQIREQSQSGWVQLNFNSGRLESWQRQEYHRVKTT